ncbi:hypothetical protein GLYMA_09G255900v4 [Glycine max]|uniref:Uncharacterized protein n=1 Tax=Glycine max TaxID=3847 RepID=K7LG23_SOYBN|nr:hypothetical protein GLYMA_09G255900v4 [Glycine max]
MYVTYLAQVSNLLQSINCEKIKIPYDFYTHCSHLFASASATLFTRFCFLFLYGTLQVYYLHSLGSSIPCS